MEFRARAIWATTLKMFLFNGEEAATMFINMPQKSTEVAKVGQLLVADGDPIRGTVRQVEGQTRMKRGRDINGCQDSKESALNTVMRSMERGSNNTDWEGKPTDKFGTQLGG